jgi:N-hydroxyarylamine O-acetyltransferase
VPARGHMLVRVDLGGATYAADVGFGGLTLTAPLLLEAGTVQSTPHERCRLLQGPEGEFQLEAEIASEWKPLYRFDTSPAFPSDYAVTSYFLCKHPESHFRSDLMVARAGPRCRWVLRGARLTEHRASGASSSRMLLSLAKLEEVLESTFGICLPEDPELVQALERLLAPGA